MFTHQLTTETVPSGPLRPEHPALNDAEEMRRMLERVTGYAEFRVTLPGTVKWSQAAPAAERTITIGEAVLAYVPEDRGRIVDTIAAAVSEQKGFRLTARMLMPKGELRVMEIIGDVRVENNQVTEIYGLSRDITETVQREALSLSRARLIKSLVNDLPMPVAVLDRSLRLIDANDDWIRAHGLPGRERALGRPLGKLIEVCRDLASALVETLNGRSSRVSLKFYGAEDSRLIRRICAVIPWVGSGEETGGFLLVYGSPERVFATPDIADNVMGRKGKSLIQLLEMIERV